MALAHNLGFPRTGTDRELRARHWQLQKDAGIELLPVGDFAWHDQVLAHSLAFGAIPGRCEQGKAQWFDTESHDLAPELSADQRFLLSWEQLFDEVDEALALGHRVKPVLIGPLTFLWLGKVKGDEFDKLDLLERLLPIYGEVLSRLARQGVEWVQIDEPILGLDLPQEWKNAFERAYHILQYSPLKKLVATYFSGLGDNLGLAVGLPVDGLHVDLVRAAEQLPIVLDRLPSYKVLSLGVVDGRDAWRCDLDKALEQLQLAQQRFGANLWVAGSCSLLHSPAEVNREGQLDAELKGWSALAVQKCAEIAVLARAVENPQTPGGQQDLAARVNGVTSARQVHCEPA